MQEKVEKFLDKSDKMFFEAASKAGETKKLLDKSQMDLNKAADNIVKTKRIV